MMLVQHQTLQWGSCTWQLFWVTGFTGHLLGLLAYYQITKLDSKWPNRYDAHCCANTQPYTVSQDGLFSWGQIKPTHQVLVPFSLCFCLYFRHIHCVMLCSKPGWWEQKTPANKSQRKESQSLSSTAHWMPAENEYGTQRRLFKPERCLQMRRFLFCLIVVENDWNETW